MGEAERILQRRAEAAAEAAERQRQSEEQALARHFRQIESEVNALRTQVLAALRDAGYPGGILRVVNRKNFGKKKQAAWVVAHYSYTSRGDDLTGDIYLLSSGAFAMGEYYKEYDFAGICEGVPTLVPEAVRDGLAALLATLRR